MKKFLLVSIIAAFLISPAHAYVLYVNSNLQTSADLGLISKDSSGNLTSSVIRSGLAADSTVLSFKHNGEERILISENNSDYTENIISIYDPSDLTTPLASKDIFSTGLSLVTSIAELNGNLILAGDGNKNSGRGAILEINPDTCEIVSSYAFGSKNTVGTYSAGDISESAEVIVNNGKIYAKFAIVTTTSSGTFAWKKFPVEADSLSSFSDSLIANAVSNNFPSRYVLQSKNNNLYMSVNDDNNTYGFYKLNSLSFDQAEKVIDAWTWHFDSDGNNGFYYDVWRDFSDGNGGYVRDLYHWDGSAASKIYDIGAFASYSAAHSVLGFIKYDKGADILCVTKEDYLDDVSREEINLLVLNTDGTLLKEISGGTITSFAVVESASSNAVDPETETENKTEENKTTSTTLGSSSGGCNAGLTSLCLLLAFAFFKKH